MKILFFAKNFYLPGKIKGGMEKYLYHLIQRLKSDHEIVLVLPNRYSIQIENVKIYHFHEIKIPLLSLITVFISLNCLLPKILRKEDPDIISAFIPSFASSILFSWAKIFRIPTVINLRGIWDKKQIALRILSSFTFLYSNGIIANSPDLFPQYENSIFFFKNYFRKISKIFVANAIDTKFWAPSSSPEINHYDFLFIGNLHQEIRIKKKGFPTFFQALNALKNSWASPLKVAVLGKNDQNSLKKLIPGYSQNDFHFLGFITDTNKIREVIRNSKIYVLTSNTEGMPNSLMEAMAVGKPCISTKVGAVPQMINSGENGIIVPKKDFRTISFHLQRMLTDQELRDRLGRAARQTMVNNFSWKSNVKKVIKTYKQIIKNQAY